MFSFTLDNEVTGADNSNVMRERKLTRRPCLLSTVFYSIPLYEQIYFPEFNE